LLQVTSEDASRPMPEGRLNWLKARRLGVDAQHEAVVFMRSDCHVCRAEGFEARARVKLTSGGRSVIATLYHVTADLLRHNEAGLSDAAWSALGLTEGDIIIASHPPPVASLSQVRGKVYGQRLDERASREVIADVVAKRYSDIELASFITACAARPLDYDEMVALTRAMVDAGERLNWHAHPVVDKHCVGGLPGNRTTPIVVAIAAACGLVMPKTSSRAITSPAGTADTMETLAPVDLDLARMRRVVEQEGACVVWGGAVGLSPADDTLIRVERVLDLDSEGQLVASVLSKKIAAGSTHLVLDLPVGPTAKIRSAAAAASISRALLDVAHAFGLETVVIESDGRQPVGRGIGPALEARDVLAVLQGATDAPDDLRRHSLRLAGALLELAGAAPAGEGEALAGEVLADGRAWRKLGRICEAQGGLREPPRALHRHPLPAAAKGIVSVIDNRRLAKVAKLAGAPDAKAAGLELHVALGKAVARGEPLYTVHAETPGELAYALDYVAANPGIIAVAEL
jgi:thymidine phosphorylase